MVATFTDRNRLLKQGTGDNADTWGELLNTGVFQLLDDSADGVNSLNISTGLDITLTTANGTVDQARKRVLKLTGTPINDIQIIIPNVEKVYMIDGAGFLGSFKVTIIGSSGTGVDFLAGDTGIVYCDTVDVLEVYKTPISAAESFETWAGDTKASERTADHGRWLLVDGRTLDSITNTQYADLFGVLGTRYGGTGASNFKLPDDSGLAEVTLDNITGSPAGILTDANASIMGGVIGVETYAGSVSVDAHTLTESQIPTHSHQQQWPLDMTNAANPAATTATPMNYPKGGVTGTIINFINQAIFSKIVTPSLTNREQAPLETVSVGGGTSHTHTSSLTTSPGDNVQPARARNRFMRF